MTDDKLQIFKCSATRRDLSNLSSAICHPAEVSLFLPFLSALCDTGFEPVRPMKKIAVLLFCVCALFGAVNPAAAGNVSWGFPLPFPFLFYKFGCGNSKQTAENAYSKENGYSKDNGYSYATAAGYPARKTCACIPDWLKYHVEYDCNMRLGQTTSMPGVGGLQDP